MLFSKLQVSLFLSFFWGGGLAHILRMDEILHHVGTICCCFFFFFSKGVILPELPRWCETDFVHPHIYIYIYSINLFTCVFIYIHIYIIHKYVHSQDFYPGAISRMQAKKNAPALPAAPGRAAEASPGRPLAGPGRQVRPLGPSGMETNYMNASFYGGPLFVGFKEKTQRKPAMKVDWSEFEWLCFCERVRAAC